MTQQTRTNILQSAKHIFALSGYDGLSMRTLADQSAIGISSIYHFFADKDVLLKEIFDTTNTALGLERAKLPKRKSAIAMLKDRIQFQFTYIEDVVFVLKYFLHYRANFAHLKPGFVPPKAYLLPFGDTGENIWMTLREISDNPKTHQGVTDIIKVSEATKFNFSESTQIVEDY